MVTSEGVTFAPFYNIAFTIFQSAVIRHIFVIFCGPRPGFEGNRAIDDVERTGLWKTCGFRAGGAAQVSPSVGVISGFGNRVFFLFRGDHGGEQPIASSSGLSLLQLGNFYPGREYLCYNMTPRCIFQCDREILLLHQGTLTR